jgi:hypothetical protein
MINCRNKGPHDQAGGDPGEPARPGNAVAFGGEGEDSALAVTNSISKPALKMLFIVRAARRRAKNALHYQE